MAQIMISNSLKNELNIHLSPQKVVKLYYSKSYKSYVLCFKLGKSKKFIISSFMWKIFKRYIHLIEKVLDNGK